jgi:hypothetical protein
MDGVTWPLRFKTIGCAQVRLDTFFANVTAAVAAGNRDTEESGNHYRIVAVK